MDEIRADVVADLFSILTDRRRSPDDALTDAMAKIDATDAERLEAARLLADLGQDELLTTVRLRIDVMALTLRELQYLAAVFGVVARWDALTVSPTMTLADFVEHVPDDHAALIADFVKMGFGAG